MIQSLCRVNSVGEIADGIYVISFESGEIARDLLPGQFVNVKGWNSFDPLLRRPFSVYRTDGASVSLIFDVIGKGTRMMRQLKPGDLLDVLGPLGMPFHCNDDWETAVIVAGGLGVAPFPVLTNAIENFRKKILTCLGARSSGLLAPQYLKNVEISTDDGSRGFHGNVVELARKILSSGGYPKAKIFGCGPNRMLRSLSSLAAELRIPCEISLEGPMGCGFGICQGCPVLLSGESRRFSLMCKDGPVFESSSIVLE